MYKKYLIILGISLYFSLKTIQIYAADYEYDDLGRVTKTVYEDGSSVTYTYDANGNIVEIKVDEEDIVNDKDNADDQDENKNGKKNPTDKTDMANDLEDAGQEQVTGVKKADQGSGNEIDQEGVWREEEYGTEETDRAITDGEENGVKVSDIKETDGESSEKAEGKEKTGEDPDGSDDENAKGNIKGKFKYLAAVCMISGITAAVFFKSKQNRSNKKHDIEGKMKENEEEDHE